MALRGNLDDMGVVDLVQFVGQSRKTGALLLNSDGSEARLYYRKGNLVDARSGKDLGLEVLARIIDWTGGEFEFRPGEETDKPSLDLDLPRAVMTAVKIRDERKQQLELRRQAEEARRQQEEEQRRKAEEAKHREEEVQRRQAEEAARKQEQELRRRAVEAKQKLDEELRTRAEEARRKAEEELRRQTEEAARQREQKRPEPALDPKICEQLSQVISSAEFVQHISVLDADGRLIGEAHTGDLALDALRELSSSLYAFAMRYPRPDLKRVVVEDQGGTAVLARMPMGGALVVVAGHAASLGVVCVTSSKLMARVAP